MGGRLAPPRARQEVQLEASRSSFTTLYTPGPEWRTGLELEEQPGWPENLTFWRAQARAARMRFIGPVLADRVLIVAVWYVASVGEALAVAGEAPLVRSGILAGQTTRGGPEP